MVSMRRQDEEPEMAHDLFVTCRAIGCPLAKFLQKLTNGVNMGERMDISGVGWLKIDEHWNSVAPQKVPTWQWQKISMGNS